MCGKKLVPNKSVPQNKEQNYEYFTHLNRIFHKVFSKSSAV